MIQIYPLPFTSSPEQPVGCAYFNSANLSVYHQVQAPTILSRIKLLQARWQYCNFCGEKSAAQFYSCSTRTQPVFSFRDGIFCSTQCCNMFHASSKERRRWSHVALCSFSEYICGFAESNGTRHSIGSNASDQYEVFAQVFELVKHLHKSIDALSQELKNTQYEQSFDKWADTFDDWLQNLPSYNKQIAKRDLELFFEQLEQFPKNDAIVAAFKEITGYLFTAASPSPLPLLSTKDDRPLRIITFDGGGMRAIVTLRIVWHLMNELARLSGKTHPVRLSDYFDLAVGTSTGSIVAAGLFLLDMQIEEIQAVYNYVGENIFCNKNRYRGQKIVSNVAAKYNDGPMVDMLMKQTKMSRLDRAPLLYEPSTRPTRVVITALEVHNVNNEHLTLFRNYEPKDAEKEERIEGTNHLYLWEALRAAVAAPHYFHQYARFYAPIDPPDDGAVPFLWRGFSGYRYAPKSQLVTHKDLILNRDPAAAALIQRDSYMNEPRIFSDAGMEANNPSILAAAEARRIFPNRKIGIIISVGTGKSTERRHHETLNHQVPTPLESAFLFKAPSILKVIRDLLMAAIVNPASESEDTAHLMKILSEDLCDYARLNPTLDKEYLLDDASPETTKKMISQADSWCTSTEGASLIRTCSQKILSM